MKFSKLAYIVFILGLILFSSALGRAYISGHFTPSLWLGVAIGFVAAVYLPVKMIFSQSGIRLHHQYRVRILAGLISIIAFYVAINYLGVVFEKRVDVTQFRQHTLLPETLERVAEIASDVKMTAFVVGLPPKYLSDLFAEYERVSEGKITTEIIDPLVNIGYAAQFGEVIKGDEKRVFVQSGGERRDIDFTKQPLSQEQIGNALMQVTRKSRTVCFVTGHGERRLFKDDPEDLSTFAKHLLANNIIGKEVALDLQGGVPSNCAALVVAGPKNFLSDREQKIIQSYLNVGGDALFMPENVIVSSPDKPLTPEEKKKNPSLNSILENWGLKVADDIVVDLVSHASGDVGSPATRNYLPHRAIVGNLDYTFFVRPRSISMLKGRRESINVAPLILTSSKTDSWGESNRYLNVKFDPGQDRAGPVPIAYAAMERHEDESITRIVTITDVDFISNAYIKSYSNAQLGINAINWLTESDYEAFLSQQDYEVKRLDLTSRQKRQVLFILFLGPFLMISCGMLIWMRQL